jgi:hypothetical protein
MSLRDELLASLAFAPALPTQSPAYTPTVAEMIAKKAAEVSVLPTRPLHQAKSNKAKYDAMMRRSHYSDQTEHLIKQGITTNAFGQELDSDTTEQMMRRREVPTKRQGKKTKLTRNTSLSFNAAALTGVPGGSRNGTNLPAMMWADSTGTQVVDDIESNDEAASLMRRLSKSSRNCDTTKSNYIV